MKSPILTVLLIMLALLPLPPELFSQSQKTAFMGQVNEAWKAHDHDKTYRLATDEAVKSPINPEALVVLHEYNVLIKGNNVQAIKELDLLIETLKATRPVAVAGVEDYRAELLKQPGVDAVYPPPTSEMLEKIHALFPNEFPVDTLLLLISQRQEHSKPHPPALEGE